MSQPVKLSDALVLEARIAAATMQRSIAGQVEFWARMGKVIEPLLRTQQMAILGREINSAAILERLDTVDTAEGRARVKDFLASEPNPHYYAHPKGDGLLIREEEGGIRTQGRFVNREFVVAKSKKKIAS